MTFSRESKGGSRSPGYDHCSPPARARDASVPREKKEKKEREKNQLFISRRLNERGEHSERIKANHRERSPLP